MNDAGTHLKWIPVIERAILICIFGISLALTYHLFSEAGILSGTLYPLSQETQDFKTEDIKQINLTEAKLLFDEKEAIFIDARSLSDYIAGHIPGALHIPSYQLEFSGREFFAGLPQNTLLITYCAGLSCQSSIELALKLVRDFGYKNTRAFAGGWQAWVSSDYPIKIGDTP
jgi:rhodanese-related sulfurtransferase